MFQNDAGVVCAPDEDLTPVAVEPVLPPAEERKAPEGMVSMPEFIRDIDSIYRSSRAHVFVLHGGVNDYPDNTGIRSSVLQTLSLVYDHFTMADMCAAAKQPVPESPARQGKPIPVVVRWSVPDGLQFVSKGGVEAFLNVLRTDSRYASFDEAQVTPIEHFQALGVLNAYFKVAMNLFGQNKKFRDALNNPNATRKDRTAGLLYMQEHPEVNLTVIYEDAKMMFPAGSAASKAMGDRNAIAYLEHWALDAGIGPRNKIVLITPELRDIQESLRSGDSHIAAVRIKKPDLKQRLEWIQNFERYIAQNPARINGKLHSKLNLPDDVNTEVIANMAAGMSRVQIEGIFMDAWLQDKPIDLQSIAYHKKQAIEAEYGDILDVQQATGGWKLLGYHDQLIQWANRMIVRPMLIGDRRQMTRGAIMAGPPGTGKSWFAFCLAAECKVNFVLVDFSKFFGGTVGQTERNMDRFKEAVDALSPCVVFADELDMLGLSRQNTGDSGVSTRLLSSLMQWLSDDARWGKVVVLAATNRVDTLDPALMRPGRLDQILAVLPPAPADAKGRYQILKALATKNGIYFDQSMFETRKNPDSGLGRLLLDKRIWTGSEMEALTLAAFSKAYNRKADAAWEDAEKQSLTERDRYAFVRERTKKILITLEDWDLAMKHYRPQTQQVDAMIDIALNYCNCREYVPTEWAARFEDEEGLKSRVSSYRQHSYERG